MDITKKSTPEAKGTEVAASMKMTELREMDIDLLVEELIAIIVKGQLADERLIGELTS